MTEFRVSSLDKKKKKSDEHDPDHILGDPDDNVMNSL